MPDTYIPARVIDGYKKIKKGYPQFIRQLSSSAKAETLEVITDEVKDLFKTFDQGLSGLMKSAKTTDNPEKAKEILNKIVRVTDDYMKKTDKIEKWALKTRVEDIDKGSQIDLSESDIKNVFKMISVALSVINAHASDALKAMK